VLADLDSAELADLLTSTELRGPPSGRPDGRGPWGLLGEFGVARRDTEGEEELFRLAGLGVDRRAGGVDEGAGREGARLGGAEGRAAGAGEADGLGVTGRGNAGWPRLPAPWPSFFVTA
jgi:hypothetical protein